MKESSNYGEFYFKYGPYYSRGRFFYKPSGQLKQDTEKFYSTPVESRKLYDKEGNLRLSEYYTPDDWVDRLVATAQKDYDINLSEPFLYDLKPIENTEGKKAIMIIHANKKPLPPLGYYEPILYFTLLDFDNFRFIAKGEIHYDVTWFPPTEPGYPAGSNAKKTYFIDGKQLVIYEFKW